MAKVTLEQWKMLDAVVQHGGFAQAAQAVHKSQSSINHAVHKLEQQLGVSVLEVKGRKAELTDAGELLLRRARNLLDQAENLEEVAEGLSEGLEAEIAIAVDAIYPYSCLSKTLEQFSQMYPNTRIQLVETVLSGGQEKLLNGEVQLLIAGNPPPGFLGEKLMSVDFIAVAHAEHPLHQLQAPLTLRDLESHRQIVLRDSAQHSNLNSGWLGAEQRWTVSHISTSVDMIRLGLGFAWLPRHRVEPYLNSGEIKPLALENNGIRSTNINLVYADKDRAGPATQALAQLFTDQSESFLSNS